MKPAYYNEIDPYCAQWLRNLIKAGHIAPGDVDDRSITKVRPDDLIGYAQCHFFAGIGGWSLAARLAGWPDDRPMWSGSCPCQPFSIAGKQRGFADDRDLYPAWEKLIDRCKPPVVFGEQVTGASSWLSRTKDSLETLGYAFGAIPIEAASLGAPHRRDRAWFIADAEWNQQPRQKSCVRTPGRMGWWNQSFPWDRDWESALRALRVVDDGIQRCVEATDAARNAIVPQVAAEVIGAYMDCRP